MVVSRVVFRRIRVEAGRVVDSSSKTDHGLRRLVAGKVVVDSSRVVAGALGVVEWALSL